LLENWGNLGAAKPCVRLVYRDTDIRVLFRRRVLDMLTAEGMVAYRLHRRSDGNGD
jgi:hypothetical protein